MGRRPIGQQAMTDAERMRRYRANRRVAAPEPDRRDAEIAELRQRLADLEAEREPSRQPSPSSLPLALLLRSRWAG
jgi:hypothetical protein